MDRPNVGRATILRGDALHLALADNTVDLVVTSPPYFGLRSYQDGGEHYSGQIGDEPTPAEFVESLLQVTAECVRVLKPSGSLWVNLGDSYSGGDSSPGGPSKLQGGTKQRAVQGNRSARARRPVEEMTREDAAWLAGVIDSDGSVSIHINKQAEGRAPSFVPWMRVGQMRPEVVTRIAELTGIGNVTCDGRGVYSWGASAQQARWVLERIHPWLLIKKRQAWAAIAVARHVEERNAKGSWRQLTGDDIAYRQRLRDAVLTWNKAGADDLVPPDPGAVYLPHAAHDPRAKSLRGVPWRYALRCIDDLGLILRAEVIWSKPNGMPESVTDRVRRSHETWFCFEQSGGVEAATQSFPFCPLCGRPADARATLVKRLQELDGGVVSSDLTHKVGPNESVQPNGARRSDLDVGRVPRGSGVSELVEGDAALSQDAAHLLQDGVVAVEDEHAEVRVPVGGAGQPDSPLSVNDASEPSEVCTCVGHPLILNDEPWLPQSLSAEIMQRVADGEIDAQQAADFLAGDYARNHSVWFHFTLEPRYFSAVDEIREPHAARTIEQADIDARAGLTRKSGHRNAAVEGYRERSCTPPPNPLGKLPGSVWTIPTQPLRVPESLGIDHFAAFPMEFPRRIITGWSPAGVCTACGEGRRPVSEAQRPPLDLAWRERQGQQRDGTNGLGGSSLGTPAAMRDRTITGEACACPDTTAPTTPGVVLDPFGGTGTTALVAKALGRHGISNDMSADYCRLATWRTNDEGELARAMQVDKPREQVHGQTSLLDLFDTDEDASTEIRANS